MKRKRGNNSSPNFLRCIRKIDITDRKQAAEKLKQRNEYLEKWEKVTVGRELKMIELKKRITELEEQLATKKPVLANQINDDRLY